MHTSARDAGIYGLREETKSLWYVQDAKALTGTFQEKIKKEGGKSETWRPKSHIPVGRVYESGSGGNGKSS